jgi:hypothetical protein
MEARDKLPAVEQCAQQLALDARCWRNGTGSVAPHASHVRSYSEQLKPQTSTQRPFAVVAYQIDNAAEQSRKHARTPPSLQGSVVVPVVRMNREVASQIRTKSSIGCLFPASIEKPEGRDLGRRKFWLPL